MRSFGGCERCPARCGLSLCQVSPRLLSFVSILTNLSDYRIMTMPGRDGRFARSQPSPLRGALRSAATAPRPRERWADGSVRMAESDRKYPGDAQISASLFLSFFFPFLFSIFIYLFIYLFFIPNERPRERRARSEGRGCEKKNDAQALSLRGENKD